MLFMFCYVLLFCVVLCSRIQRRIRRHRQRKEWKKEYLATRQNSNKKSNGHVNDGFLRDNSLAYINVNQPEYYNPKPPNGFTDKSYIKAEEFVPDFSPEFEHQEYQVPPAHDPRVDLHPQPDLRHTDLGDDGGTLRSNISTVIPTDSESQHNKESDIYESDYDLKQFDQPGFIGAFEAGEAQYIDPRDEKEELYTPRTYTEPTGTAGYISDDDVIGHADVIDPGAHGTDVIQRSNVIDDDYPPPWGRTDDTVSSRTSLSTTTLPLSLAHDDTASTVFNADTYIPSFTHDAYLPQDPVAEEVFSTHL